MESNEYVRKQILEDVNNQIKTNNPPETKATYKRLLNEGFDDLQAKQMIGQCIIVEIYDVMKLNKPYDKERFIRNLNKLPEKPFEEE